MKVVLLFQVGLVVFTDIMIDKRYGHNGRDMALAVVVDDFQQLLLFVRGQPFLEISYNVVKHIDVLLGRCLQPQGFHEYCFVLSIQVLG